MSQPSPGSIMGRRWKRYSQYQPTPEEWLPELPAHWHLSRLKYLATASSRRAVGKTAEDIYVGLEQIESKTGRLRLDNPVETVESTMGVFEQGDVLFGKLRPYLAKVATTDFSGVCTTELIVFRPEAAIHSEYLKFLLLSEQFIDFVSNSAYGTKMPRVSEEQLRDIHCAVPPLPEQRQIATFITRKTARIDSLIERKERLITLLEEKRQTIISHTVTRGLDPSAQLKDSGVEWIGKIPSHWAVRRLKQVCRLETGHTPRKSEDSFWISEECNIPWISLNDTKRLESSDFIDDTTVKISAKGMQNSAAHLVDAGAVVFNRDGARVGLTAITTKPMCLSQHLIGWVCGSDVSNRYLLHVMYAMEQEIYRLAGGSTIPTIGMPEVKGMVMPLPPRAEQEAITTYVLKVRAQISGLIQHITEHIALLKEYRSALICAAVTGQIDVRGEVTT